MDIRLVAFSPDIEATIATSMKTTTSGALPSTLFNMFKDKPEKVADIVSRVEVQHGNVLEHNRLVWRIEASSDKVLDIMLDSRFLTITDADDSWIVSGNLRSVTDLYLQRRNEFTEALVNSINQISPRIYEFIRRCKR